METWRQDTLSPTQTLYNITRIMESVSKVIFLTFSSDGSQLLVVLSMGRVHLYTKGAGLHQWTSSHTCDWDGEDILHINFFHGGIRVGFYFTFEFVFEKR
ncbi:hypothetical protein E2C01_047072 [Portunus trituberculatus]|uniref:Uncharacterized protein n=1 Tax=Portunus trituberculatus TaxID=210409 RepID=A0A5B7G6Y8_PORTR|nr:hypothetical protein [Portunus trituberculatus]